MCSFKLEKVVVEDIVLIILKEKRGKEEDCSVDYDVNFIDIVIYEDYVIIRL